MCAIKDKALLSNEAFDDSALGFYQASRGALNWSDALLPLRDAVSARGIQLNGVDQLSGCVAFLHVAGDIAPEAASAACQRIFHQLNPAAALALQSPPGSWIHGLDLLGPAAATQNSYGRDFLIAHGLHYCSTVRVLQDGSLSAFLIVYHGGGRTNFSAHALHICNRQVRYLADALGHGGIHPDNGRSGRFLAELLSRLQVPLVLLDGQCRIHFANSIALQLLSRSGSLLKIEPRLTCACKEDDDGLTHAVSNLSIAPLGEARGPQARASVPVHSADGQRRLTVHLYPIGEPASLPVLGMKRIVMAVFHERDLRLDIDPVLITEHYGLTPAEARVAAALARGQSPEQICLDAGVTINTVRSQLRSIFEKTGTSRQTELVSALSSLPLVGVRLSTT